MLLRAVLISVQPRGDQTPTFITKVDAQQTFVALFGLSYNQVKRLLNKYSKCADNLYSTQVLLNILMYIVSPP